MWSTRSLGESVQILFQVGKFPKFQESLPIFIFNQANVETAVFLPTKDKTVVIMAIETKSTTTPALLSTLLRQK